MNGSSHANRRRDTITATAAVATRRSCCRRHSTAAVSAAAAAAAAVDHRAWTFSSTTRLLYSKSKTYPLRFQYQLLFFIVSIYDYLIMCMCVRVRFLRIIRFRLFGKYDWSGRCKISVHLDNDDETSLDPRVIKFKYGSVNII